MNMLITGQAPHSTPANRFLRWSRDLFIVAGVLTLGYCAFVLLDSKLYQADQARRFQQQLSTTRAGVASGTGVRELPAPPSSGGALGTIEIARIGLEAV